MSTNYGVLLVSQPNDPTLVRQIFMVNINGKTVIRWRLTNGKQGKANAWYNEGTTFAFDGDEKLLGTPVAIPVTQNDLDEYEETGFPRVLVQKLIRKWSLNPQTPTRDAQEANDEVFESVRLEPQSLAKFYADNRGRKRDVIKIERIATTQSIDLENERSLYIPSLEEFSHYIPRTFAGDVTEAEMYSFALKNKMNVLLSGDAGTGKTSSAMWIASQLGLPFFAIPSNSALDYTQIVGGYVPNANGSLSWVDGAVTRLVRHGGTLLIGEVNTLAKNVQQFLMPLLDYRRSITVMDNGNEVIKAHDNLLIIADMNPNYRGTQLLNEAWKDRFEIKLDYGYDRSIEGQILKSSSLLDLAYGMRSRSRGTQSRITGDNNTIFETPVSTRILKTFEKLATNLSFEFACEVFVNNFDDNERPAVKLLLEANDYNLKTELGLTDDSPLRDEVREDIIEQHLNNLDA